MFLPLATAAVSALIVIAVALWVGLVGMKASWSAWYDEIKSWQLGLGAFAGLVAIIAGAMVNAELTRDRDDRLRDRDAKALADALHGEATVAVYRLRFVQTRLKWLADHQPIDVRQIEALAIPRFIIYEASLDRLGLLGDLVPDVADFFESLESVRSNFGAIVRASKSTGRVDPDWLVFGESDFELMARAGDSLKLRLKTFADSLADP